MLGGLCTNLRFSSLYETRPLYVTDQPLFLNAAVEGRTSLTPDALLDGLQSIEKALGRDRSKERRMGPRTLDLDVLLFGREVIESPRLTIPHPRLAERAFALIPLLELAPDLRDPRTRLPFAEALARIGDQGVYSYPPR
jgi:2-amino-4-hydroxy-6-hydroxymethyldihydropteridine diphosphokinase